MNAISTHECRFKTFPEAIKYLEEAMEENEDHNETWYRLTQDEHYVYAKVFIGVVPYAQEYES